MLRLSTSYLPPYPQTEGYQLVVDLEAQQVKRPDGEAISFEVDAFRKHCLLNGLDDIGLTLEKADSIKQFESQWRQQSPWLFDVISSANS